VKRLPAAHREPEYLRLREVPLYLDSCFPVYRPLTEVLVSAGLWISEALAQNRTRTEPETPKTNARAAGETVKAWQHQLFPEPRNRASWTIWTAAKRIWRACARGLAGSRAPTAKMLVTGTAIVQ
jgi:hypothetical protein